MDKAVDVGDVRGNGHVAFFVYDATRLASIQGCSLPVSQSIPGRCFAGVPVRMSWALKGDTLTFGDYQAEGSNDQYLINPWRKIG